jgi:outer membrane protein
VRIADEKSGDTFLVGGSRELGQDGAFVPQLRNGATLSAQANLYDFGRTKAAIAAGEAARDAVKASGEVSEEALVRAVRGSYLSWLGAYEQLRQNLANRDDADTRTGRVRALVAEGVRPKSDVAPAETELLLSELELTRAKGAESDARLLLEHLTGTALSESAEPDRSVLDRQLPEAPANPELDAGLRALALQREAMLATSRAQKKERLPVLGAGLSVGVRNQFSFVFPTYGAGLSLSVPLWDGGMANANAEASKARSDELSMRMQERKREQAFAEARAKKKVEQAEAQLTVASALLEQCQKRLGEAEQGYQVSAFGIDQVYAARSVLRRAEIAVLEARLARTSAVLDVAPVARAQ